MHIPTFHITRWLVPFEQEAAVDSDGFLVERDSVYGRYACKNLVSLLEAAVEPVVLLLGNAGEGKSSELKRFQTEHCEECRYIDLGTLTPNQLEILSSRVLEGVQDRLSAAGDSAYYLLLDSFDEAILPDERLVQSLSGEVSTLLQRTNGRLRVVVASRTTKHVFGFKKSLQESTLKLSVATYKMAPLSRSDVSCYLVRKQHDPILSMRTIVSSGLVPLATNPLLLRLLASCIDPAQVAHVARSAVYQRALLGYCEETDRREDSIDSMTTPQERYNTAAHIALGMLFSKHNQVSIGRVDAEGVEVLSVNDMVGDGCYTSNATLINKMMIRETLRTSLFASLPEGTYQWQHRTYCEFLAAVALSQSSVHLEQIRSIFVSYRGNDRWIPSHLFTCASFLIELRPECLDLFLEIDPEVGIWSDVRFASDDDKCRIAQAVLEHYSSGLGYDKAWNQYRRYAQLSNAALGGVLQPYIMECGRDSIARRVAIDIAGQCKVVSMVDGLVGLALNEAEPRPFRMHAVDAIRDISINDKVSLLRPLVQVEGNEEDECQLLGAALLALWPNHIDIHEVIAVISVVPIPKLYGAYRSFVHDYLPANLHVRDLLPLFALFMDRSSVLYRHDDVQDLVLAAVHCLLQRALEEAYWEALADYIADCLGRFSDPLDGTMISRRGIHAAILDVLKHDDAVRRTLIKLLASRSQDSWTDMFLSHTVTYLFSQKDQHWALARLDTGLSDQSRRFYHIMIVLVTNWSAAASVNMTLEAAFGRHSDLKWFLSRYIDAVSLEDRPVVHDRLSSHADAAAIAQAMTDILSKSSVTAKDTWPSICHMLDQLSDAGPYSAGCESDLTQLSSWKLLMEEMRQSLVRQAARFLREGSPVNDVVSSGPTMSYHDVAAYMAVRLLYRYEPDGALLSDPAVWLRWAPAIASFPTPYGFGDYKEHAIILGLASERSQRRINDILVDMIRTEISRIQAQSKGRHGDNREVLFSVLRMEYAWNEDLERRLQSLLPQCKATPFALLPLLNFMLDHGSRDALDFVQDVLRAPPADTSNDRSTWVACGIIACERIDASQWVTFWDELLRDDDRAREVLLKFADRVDRHKWAFYSRLESGQLAEVYIALSKLFPNEEDPVPEGAISSRHDVADLRDGIVQFLIAEGSDDSVAALEKMSRATPNRRWMAQAILDARRVKQDLQSSILLPRELYGLVNDPQKRIVNNENDLLSVIVESLERLQNGLHGETPVAPFMWNELGGGLLRPKNEEQLSDYVKIHLEKDLTPRHGIVLNREVQIRPKSSTGGQRTDIHVDACVAERDTYNIIRVIIETKGCWNPDLKTSMKEQLAERYLANNASCAGLYLVGYFGSDRWDTEDWRHSRCGTQTLEDLRGELASQAEQLSEAGYAVKSFVLDVSY